MPPAPMRAIWILSLAGTRRVCWAAAARGAAMVVPIKCRRVVDIEAPWQLFYSPSTARGRLLDLVGNDLEALQGSCSKRRCDRDVGGIATRCHQDAADARYVVAGIERPPA